MSSKPERKKREPQDQPPSRTDKKAGDRGAIVPFPEVVPNADDACDVLTIAIRRAAGIPDDDYAFFDAYCGDPDCDCRVIYILVLARKQPGQILAMVTMGFEPIAFYQEWMGSPPGDKAAATALKGPALAPVSPQNSLASLLLQAASPHLTGRMEVYRRHYFQFKKALELGHDASTE